MFKNTKSAKNLLENTEFATSNLGQVDLKIYFSILLCSRHKVKKLDEKEKTKEVNIKQSLSDLEN